MEVKFVLLKDIKIVLGDEEFKFSRGDKLLLMISYKATIPDLKKLLSDTGYKMVDYFTDNKKTWALVLCQPVPL